MGLVSHGLEPLHGFTSHEEDASDTDGNGNSDRQNGSHVALYRSESGLQGSSQVESALVDLSFLVDCAIA